MYGNVVLCLILMVHILSEHTVLNCDVFAFLHTDLCCINISLCQSANTKTVNLTLQVSCGLQSWQHLYSVDTCKSQEGVEPEYRAHSFDPSDRLLSSEFGGKGTLLNCYLGLKDQTGSKIIR
jgi:hypothetical protein